MDNREQFHLRVRPEYQAGAFGRSDADINFYGRVNALLRPDGRVLEYGAGRGSFQGDPSIYRRNLRMIRGKVSSVVGADIDPIVLENESVDERVVFKPNEPLPFADNEFDLVVCDWVLEHIEFPKGFEAEIHRILKPGGWFCGRTPNRWGLTGMAVRMIPDWLEKRVLKMVWPERSDEDVFPKYYRLNTWSAIKASFPPDRWANASYGHNGEPKYHANNPFLFRLMALWNVLVPPQLATDLFIFLRKS